MKDRKRVREIRRERDSQTVTEKVKQPYRLIDRQRQAEKTIEREN